MLYTYWNGADDLKLIIFFPFSLLFFCSFVGIVLWTLTASPIQQSHHHHQYHSHYHQPPAPQQQQQAQSVNNMDGAIVTSPSSSSGSMTGSTTVNNNNNNVATTNPAQLIEEIATENFWLREKMKEISADRDRLLCEVANLRLELDMAELKRLPEDRWVTFYFSIWNSY